MSPQQAALNKIVGKEKLGEAAPAAHSVHFDVMEQIKGFDRSKLRKVNMRRSLGGTPIKENTEEVGLSGEAAVFASIVIRDDSSDDDSSSEESEGF